MAQTPRWTRGGAVDGVTIVTLSSWEYFSEYISKELLDYRAYIYRGHASATWKLESTLDRSLKSLAVANRTAARMRHLSNFKLAVRGRRGNNPAILQSENDWWALGQHNGLATPLLDFTESPFVALYFAFHEKDTAGDDHRAVWALWQYSISEKTDKDKPKTTCVLVRPLTDENARLVSQRGLFVRAPDEEPVESWIRSNYSGETRMHAIQIRIPDKDRLRCLRWLNRTNINHLSLFPDLFGASIYCNDDLKIPNY